MAGRTNRDLVASIGPGKKLRINGLPAIWLDPLQKQIQNIKLRYFMFCFTNNYFRERRSVPIIIEILYWPAVRTVNLTLATFALFGLDSDPNSLRTIT